MQQAHILAAAENVLCNHKRVKRPAIKGLNVLVEISSEEGRSYLEAPERGVPREEGRQATTLQRSTQSADFDNHFFPESRYNCTFQNKIRKSVNGAPEQDF